MRRGLPPLGWSLLLGLLLCGNAGAQGKPEPRIAFEDEAVVASGLTPGKTVAWFGVERIVDPDLAAELVQHSNAKTAGADGVSRLELKHPVAQRSLWVAVDVETGDFVVASPDGYQIRRRPRPSRLAAGQGGRPDEIEDGPSYLFGLMVRPGEGAWIFRGGDGAPLDADGETDGRVRFALDGLEPLPGSPAPPARTRGTDLWFVVDLLKMQIAVHKGGAAL
ncbi:MAG TPA: hypothetical protein VF789_10140 [Thermoanaerobaculia bacterium]